MSRSCARGGSDASQATKNVLLAESGGFCQNPDCNQSIFKTTFSGQTVHFAELAHIIAASPGGARGDDRVGETERAGDANLLVLCANCHKVVDKADADYPVDLLREWKSSHRARLDAVFGVQTFNDRESLRGAIDPLLRLNKLIHAEFGPDSAPFVMPYDDRADTWRVKVREDILPNNLTVVRLLEVNERLLTEDERETVAALRQHVLDLERRHLGEAPIPGGSRWPRGMGAIAEPLDVNS